MASKKDNRCDKLKSKTGVACAGGGEGPSMDGQVGAVCSGTDQLMDKPNASVSTPVMDDINKEALIALRDSLKKQIEELNEDNKKKSEMSSNVINAYDAAIAEVKSKTATVAAQNGVLVEELKDLIAQRDVAQKDLRNTETAFADVFKKYERSKVTLENLKKNEETLKKRDTQMQAMIHSREEKFEMLKMETNEMLRNMHLEFTGTITSKENENARMAAHLRRLEMRSETLTSERDQKQKENEELNKLVDELIATKSETSSDN